MTRIFLLSTLILYVEMLLIRWLLEVTGVSRAALTAITLAVYLGARLALGRKGRATSSCGQHAPC